MKNNIGNILRKELREVFRDRKSLAMMLIIPFMIPLLVIGMSALFDSEVNISEDVYNDIGFAYELSEVEKSILDSMNIEYVEGSLEDIEKNYEESKITAYVTKNNNNYFINYSDTSDYGSYAHSLAEGYLNAYKQVLQQNYLAENQIKPEEVLDIITINTKVMEAEDNFFANYITVYAFLFVIMAITTSATYPATDATAGEKERGTLETLLTFPIRSRDIIIGKLISVTTTSTITGLLSLVLSLISLFIANKNFGIYEGLNIVPSLGCILASIVIILMYALFISGLCLSISSKAKTFREAQSALTPLTFISFFPSMIAFMVDTVTTPLLSAVPFLNFTLIFTDINAGNIDILNILIMVVSTLVYISLVIRYIVKEYQTEKVLFTR